jgi:hypothetical protein
MMVVADIRKMKEGLPFRIFPGVEQPAINYTPASYEIFLQFIELFCTCKRWGLPNGHGWANESELCMKVLMHFDELQDKIDVWRVEKSNKGS